MGRHTYPARPEVAGGDKESVGLFMASEFITQNELPPLLAAAEAEGVTILPVILSPCRFNRTPSLSQFQAVNPPDKPLINMQPGEREAVWQKLTDTIEDVLANPY